MFEREHGERLRELQAAMRASRYGGGEMSAEQAAELAELNEQAPSGIQLQQKLWELLTPTQQATMRELIRQKRQELVRQRQMRAAGMDIQADDGSVATDGGMGGTMNASDDEMMMMTGSERSENTRDVPPGQLDAAARKRLAFLRKHQLSQP
jgi:hypothetical protein